MNKLNKIILASTIGAASIAAPIVVNNNNVIFLKQIDFDLAKSTRILEIRLRRQY